MTTRYLPAAVLLMAIVLFAYLIGRYRRGHLRWRVDGIVVPAIIGLGVAAFAMTTEPTAIALVGLPAMLAVGGAYLMISNAPDGEPVRADRRTLVRLGAGAAIFGSIGAALGILRVVL